MPLPEVFTLVICPYLASNSAFSGYRVSKFETSELHKTVKVTYLFYPDSTLVWHPHRYGSSIFQGILPHVA